MIQNLVFGRFFWKDYSRHTIFLYQFKCSSGHQKHFENKVCTFLYISIRNLLFQRRSKILCIWGWFRIISLRRLTVQASQNVLHFLILMKFLGIQLFFSISVLPHIALKRRNFADNLDFKNNIFAKFLIRSHFL